jgi:alkylated DNA repair protein (DNA oxidative demethylase)
MRDRTLAIPPDRIKTIRQLSEFLTVQEDRALRLFAGRQRHWDRLGAKWRLSFGWIYNVRTKLVIPGFPIPFLLRELAARVASNELTDGPADQIVFQVYREGQGLSAHIDAGVFYGPVVSVSLLSCATMRFIHPVLGRGPDLVLEPRSVISIAGEARTEWLHEILKVRETRWSLTFRTVRR